MSDTSLLQALSLAHNPWHAQMVLTTASAITASTWTQVPFDTILYDPATMCTVGAAAKITVPVQGLYSIKASAGTAASVADGTLMMVDIAHNAAVGGGPGEYRLFEGATGAAVPMVGGGAIDVSAAAGDYFAVGVWLGAAAASLAGSSSATIYVCTLSVTFSCPT
jgi:hypothetical protein